MNFCSTSVSPGSCCTAAYAAWRDRVGSLDLDIDLSPTHPEPNSAPVAGTHRNPLQHHPQKTAHPLVFGSFAWDSLFRKFFARSIAFCCWRKHSGQIPWVVGVSNPCSMNFSSGIHSPLWSMRRHQAQTRMNASNSRTCFSSRLVDLLTNNQTARISSISTVERRNMKSNECSENIQDGSFSSSLR